MSRIKKTFAALKRPALVTFITAGDPDYAQSLAVLKGLPAAGADIIELGMPFTDPMADGPVIQAAGLRALKSGGGMKQTLKMVSEFRKENKETPIVLMGYANPVFIYGIDKFVKDANTAGVDGLIIVDLPPEEDSQLRTAAQKAGIDFIKLLTPTTDTNRLPAVLKSASGFLYYVSVAGITGAAKANTDNVKTHIDEIKKHTKLPIAIGFGIKNANDVKGMASIGQAVVVGSAIVQTIANNQNDPELPQLVARQVGDLAKDLHK
jgi:tryptophan synthase alpha chain